MRTKRGSILAALVQVGDKLLSRNEHDPDGEIVESVVEEVFVRDALVMELKVAGQVIETTAEHPFYVADKGWTNCQELQVGDTIRTEEGWTAVEAVVDTGRWETVYNFRIAEHHTYFVGCDEWGWAVWAHNANDQYLSAIASRTEGTKNQRIVISHDGSVVIPVVPAKGSPKTGSRVIEKPLAIGFDNVEQTISFMEGAWQRGHTENNVKIFKVKGEFLEYLRKNAILEHEVRITPGGKDLPQRVDLPATDQYVLKIAQIRMLRDAIQQGSGQNATVIHPNNGGHMGQDPFLGGRAVALHHNDL